MPACLVELPCSPALPLCRQSPPHTHTTTHAPPHHRCLTHSAAALALPCLFSFFFLLLQGERDELHSVVADLEVQLETCAAECSSGSDDTGATGEDEEPTWTTPEFTGEDNGEEGSEDPEFV